MKQNFIITGYVRSENDKQGIEDVIVRALYHNYTSSRTNAEGYFALELENIDTKIIKLNFIMDDDEIYHNSYNVPANKNILRVGEILIR